MNSLVADYGDDTDTDSCESDFDQDGNTKNKITDQTKPVNKLPAPRFKEMGVLNESVFRNPYLEAERARSAVLEKHVKMVPTKEYLTQINGRNICWMNKKGHCRFGNNCKFAHDSELFNDPNVTNKVSNDSNVTNKANNDPNVTNKVNNNLNKIKKRPGLSQTLTPGKKIWKKYLKTNGSVFKHL